MKLTISIMLSFMLFCACTSFFKEPAGKKAPVIQDDERPYTGEMIAVNKPKPTGEDASVRLMNGMQYSGELIAINDTMLFFDSNNHLLAIPLSHIKGIHLHGHSLKTEKIVSMMALVLMDGAIASMPMRPGLAVPFCLLIPTTIAAFLTGNPKVDYSSLFTKSNQEELKLYCRYPQGLTEDQWKQLLQYYKQEGFVTPPVR